MSCGTTEESSIWYSHPDSLSGFCVLFVLMVMCYIGFVISSLYEENYVGEPEVIALTVLSILSVWSYVKVMFTDPGSVPKLAKPLPSSRRLPYTICGRCEAYKPPGSHHGNFYNLLFLGYY